MQTEKTPIQSKTFWTNLLVIIVATLTFLLDQELVKNNVDLVRYFTIAIGAINIALRFLTTQPMRFTTSQEK